MNKREIEKRIAKATTLDAKLDTATAEIETGEKIREMAREDTIADVLAELLASLAAGESLQDAIETIHSNF